MAGSWAGLLDAQSGALTAHTSAANLVWTAYANEIGAARSGVIGLESAAWVDYQQTRSGAEDTRDIALAAADAAFGDAWAVAQSDWLDSEAAASHTLGLSINAAVDTLKNDQRDADADLLGADNIAGRDRDLAVNTLFLVATCGSYRELSGIGQPGTLYRQPWKSNMAPTLQLYRLSDFRCMSVVRSRYSSGLFGCCLG